MLNDGTHAPMECSVQISKAGLAWSPLSAGTDDSAILEKFGVWYEHHADSINVHPAGPRFLLAPNWFS